LWSETIGSAKNVHVFVIVHVLDRNVPDSLEMEIQNRRDGRESRILWDAVSFTSTSTAHEPPLPGAHQNHLLRRWILYLSF
jgi:hypothetical protein